MGDDLLRFKATNFRWITATREKRNHTFTNQ